LSGASEKIAPAYLVTGSDAALVGLALAELLERLSELSGGSAAQVVVEEHWPTATAAGRSAALAATAAGSRSADDEADGDEGDGDEVTFGGGGGGGATDAASPGGRQVLELGPVLDACATPPFLADRRIVAVRHAHLLDAGQLKRLAAYLEDPLPTSVLVLSSDGKPAPAALLRLLRKSGSVIDTEVGSGARARGEWFDAHLRRAPVRLRPDAKALLIDNLGDDLARLPGLLATLASAYGAGTTIGAEELQPFLGEAGEVAPWALTDAIDAGDIDGALTVLHRMLASGDRHALQVLAVLHRHFGAMLRLDGSGVENEAGAASLLGMSPFPASKILRQGRDLGHDRVVRAILLLAAADLDLRGLNDMPADTTLEVLVARLAQLRRGSATRRSPAGRR
jgi:DNA polymerase III subunit delta